MLPKQVADTIESLQSRVAELEAERDQYRADRDSQQRGAIDAGLKLLAANRALHGLLWYAKHYPACPMWGATEDEVCNCGLSDLLANYAIMEAFK